MLDAGYLMLDPPTRPNLPADDADNADTKRKTFCGEPRDLRDIKWEFNE
jgi:hypothetical protein